MPTDAPLKIVYPESDGKLMADNTKQFRWIVVIKENLELLFAAIADVFVAGDLLWYPVEGNNAIRQAPDVMVAFGRHKGDRSSYKQWEEDNIPPKVVFEILSPGNRLREMARKFQFYQQYGVEEYYVYDPDRVDLIGWLRSGQWLEVIEEMNGWVSPSLGIRFELQADTLEILSPSGERFLSHLELAQQRDLALAQLEQERQRYQALSARLQEMGIDPEQLQS